MKRIRAAALSAMVVSHLLFTAVHAQPLSNIPRQDFWVTDGPVWAMVATDDTLYLGGEFTYVGPPTGHGVPVDLATGKALDSYPCVNGPVRAVVPDGAGGWFIGGDFTKVGGLPRQNLARILAGGEVDADWMADADGMVKELVIGEGRLFVAGKFTTINGTARHSLAALDTTTGEVVGWNPQPDGEVKGLALLDGTLYFGGDFSHVSGVERITLAAVDAATGALMAWPNYQGFPPSGFRAIAAAANKVFVSAHFPTPIEFGRDFVTMHAETGQVLWVHHLNGVNNPWNVTEIEASPGLLLVTRGNGIASLNPDNGQIIWSHGTFGWIAAIEIVGAEVIVGGYPGKFWPEGIDRKILARLDATTGEILDWNPLANAWVMSLASSGNVLYVGGLFSSYGGVKRKGLAAIDIPSGKATKLDLPVSGHVYALALHEQDLLMGGSFSEVAGRERRGLAAADTRTGDILPWAPTVRSPMYNGVVRALEVDGSKLYVGGDFTNATGVARSNLAALDLMTGATLPWQADANGPVYKLAKSGDLLVVGGAFTEIGAQPRSRLAALDLLSGAPADWNPAPSSNVTGLAVSGSTVYFAGPFESVAETPRVNLAAADLATGQLLPWAPTAISTKVHEYATSTPLLIRGAQVLFGNRGTYLSDPPNPASLHVFDALTGLAASSQPQTIGPIYCLVDNNGRLFAGGAVSPGGLLAFDHPGFSRLEPLPGSNGGLRLRLHGDEGATYELDAGTLNDDWSPLGEHTILGGSATLRVPLAPGGSRFFRARLKE